MSDIVNIIATDGRTVRRGDRIKITKTWVNEPSMICEGTVKDIAASFIYFAGATRVCHTAPDCDVTIDILTLALPTAPGSVIIAMTGAILVTDNGSTRGRSAAHLCRDGWRWVGDGGLLLGAAALATARPLWDAATGEVYSA